MVLRRSFRSTLTIRGTVIAIAILLAFPCAILCQEPDGSPEAPLPTEFLKRGPDTVRGVVLNRLTREPIPRALVTTNDRRYAALTDDRGRFEFKFPGPEKSPRQMPADADSEEGSKVMSRWAERSLRAISLEARRLGFLEEHNLVAIPATGGGTANFEILLDPEAVVSGHVRFPDGTNSLKARVLLYRQELEEERERWTLASAFDTWSDGAFRFYNLPPGVYRLLTEDGMEREFVGNAQGQAFGFPAAYYPNAPDFPAALAFRVHVGEHMEADIPLSRREYYLVQIPITNYTSSGPPTVRVFLQGRPGPGYTLSYDARTRNIHGSLPDGSYSVAVEAGDEETPSSGSLNFVVRGGPVQGESITLLPNPTLSVVVKTAYQHESLNSNDEGGNERQIPAEMLGVMLRRVQEYTNEHLIQASREPDDSPEMLRIPGVPPGTYWVSATGYVSYVASVVSDGVDLLRQPLTVGPEGTTSPIEITLRDDGAEVSGRVQATGDARSETISNANESTIYVCLVPAEGTSRMSIQTTPRGGAFYFRQVPPGTYRLLAFEGSRPSLNLNDEKVLQKYEATGIQLNLVSNQKEQLSAPVPVVREP